MHLINCVQIVKDLPIQGNNTTLDSLYYIFFFSICYRFFFSCILLSVMFSICSFIFVQRERSPLVVSVSIDVSISVVGKRDHVCSTETF